MAFLPSLSFVSASSLIFLFSFLAAFLLVSRKNKKEYSLKAEVEDTQGRINIAYQQLEVEELKSRSLRFKLRRYDALAVLTEKLNQNLSLDDIIKMLLDETNLLFGQEKYVGMVYLVDKLSGTLSLWRHKGDGRDALIIKEKYGDIFDQWVLKHMQPLLVEDAANDFRFDLRKLQKTSTRAIGSLISGCLISQNRPIGIVRLETPLAHAFTLEELRLLSTIADIAGVAIENAQYYQHIKELAIKDSLTEVYTRKFILERLDQELKRGGALATGVAVMMIDIDFFKRYNDQCGHVAGDVVLQNLCVWLKSYAKAKNALVGRYGGEEFLIMAPLCTKQEAFTLAENIRSAVQEKRVMLRRKTTPITISVGVAHFPQDAMTLEELLNKADIALYEAKKLGRNRVCLF